MDLNLKIIPAILLEQYTAHLPKFARSAFQELVDSMITSITQKPWISY
ncbi:MAG: hypothetical protein K0R65_458 [Crocinitomicaceae bacterium]|jgi:hypothetical protein|nr:hypothetical protein [Crocinitomicaceae bacterium]